MFSRSKGKQGLDLSASIEADGRLGLSLRRTQRRSSLSTLLSQSEYSTVSQEWVPSDEDETDSQDLLETTIPTRLHIVIQVVGSRGDVQPFVALGLVLNRNHGHRVRVATHGVFKKFVEEHGLEFFDIGGDPEQLMAFMVRNPGLLPGYSSLACGDVRQQRENMRTILKGCWMSCCQPTATGPFVADVIIANPPSFAHIHCAEKLGVPLHLMFTMPYSPTEAFPHPLANVRSSDLNPGFTNKLSFALVERITWHGLGDIINKFRDNSLGLAPINLAWAPGLITRLDIPHTYCWSPTVLKKPKEWGSRICVSGFYTLPASNSFNPPADLLDFLKREEPPVYIGFGSIVVDDPQAMTDMVFTAIEKAGVRALISKGWSQLGTDGRHIPSNVFLLGDVPHDWLFEHVSAVVHHGGAGTTAAGLAAGKPTVIVPFFGDQAFWGTAVANAGAGPHPVPYSTMTAEVLASQIRQALDPKARLQARHIQLRMRKEDGCEVGARHFHRMLCTKESQCALVPNRRAVWLVKGRGIKLSAIAGAVLIDTGCIGVRDLQLYRTKEYTIKDSPTDPITGGALAFLGSFSDVAYQVYAVPRGIAKSMSNASQRSSSGQLQAVNAPEMGHPELPYHSAVGLAEQGETQVHSPHLNSRRLKKGGTVALTALSGIGDFSKALLSSPMHFSMGIARGFQSIPIAYGDKSVREPEKVTGLLKGFEVGGKELAYGFYDGITGVVTQPMQGLKESGAAGFTKGLARGLGGLILKPGAGIFGLPAYSLQGVNREVQNILGTDYESWIKQSRLEQGGMEMGEIGEREKLRILKTWAEH